MEENDAIDGYLIEYKCYRRIGEDMQTVTDSLIFQGSIADFKKDPAFRGSAIQRYTQVCGGEMDESSAILVNEPLKPLPGSQQLNPEIKGAIDPSTMADAPKLAQIQPGMTAPLKIDLKPKILKDGDSYIKIEGSKVSRLVWVEYNDETQPFDQKVRIKTPTDSTDVNDCYLEITKWQSLEEADHAAT